MSKKSVFSVLSTWVNRAFFPGRETDRLAEEKIISPGKQMLRSFLHNKLAMTGLCIFLACLLLFPINWGEVFRDDFFRALWKVITEEPDALLYLFEMCVMVALGLALLTMMVYLAMAVGQMFSHRIVMSVVAFIGLDILASLYLDLTNELELVGLVSRLREHAGLWMANAMILLPAAVLFLANTWLLKHRLNLE